MINWSLLTGSPTAPPVVPTPALTTPSPASVAASLNQSEWIAYDDVAALAGRLVKQKSEHHQRIGRTISKMLRGELYAAPEPRARNQTLFQVAGELLEAFPYAAPDSLTEHFQISIARMAEETDARNPGNPAPTLDEFRSMLVRHQGPKQGKHATLTEAQRAIAEFAQSPDAPKGPVALAVPHINQANTWQQAVTTPANDADFGAGPAIAGPTAAELAGLDRRSLIVRVSDTLYLLRHPHAATYDLRVTSSTGLRIELQRRFVDAGLPLELTDDDGEMLPIEKVVRSYAMNAHAVVYDYAAASTTFDQTSSLVRLGLQMGRLPDLRVIEPEHSDAVELWLYTLCGGTDEAMLDLYDWIAGTDQRHINHAAAALVIQGPPSIGKTQFARGLAMTWGCSEPVALAVALDRFNGALTRSPIWFADEHMPEGLDASNFRRIVQDQERAVEFKGQERGLLAGCSRVLLAVNDPKDLSIAINGGNQDAMRATEARLAMYESCNEQTCVAALMAIAGGQPQAEKMAIARHLRSIQVNETPKAQRFYGARAGGGVAQEHLLSTAFAYAQSTGDAIAEYLIDPISWERHYGLKIPIQGARFPIYVTPAGELRICPSELAAKLELQLRDYKDVERALAPFVTRQRRASIGGRDDRFRGRYSEIDAKLLAKALGIDCDTIEHTMKRSTTARRKEVGINDE
jgi:hypothetical protein